MRLTIAVTFSFLIANSVANAQTLTLRRLASPPHIGDFAQRERSTVIDAMTPVEGLIQRSPVDGDPITERTDVYLGFDAGHLYAAFVCWYAPGALHAHRVNRDRIPDDDDSVALHLDTFRDRKHLYGFQVNPAGVQVDGVFTEGRGWDLSFDTVWQAETSIESNRYIVLITVPFNSIRFPAVPEQDWGVFVYRGIPRKNEEAFWPAYSNRFQGRVAYAAHINGVGQIESGHSTQVTPYGSVRAARTSGANDFTENRAGVDVKTVLRSGLVADFTANPDFSQVESDEPQTTVNKRFEVYFPEKRPFFLENANYFDTPIQAVFTRRIRDPQLGARLTGKSGSYAIGALVIDDDAATADGQRAVNGIVRISRELAADSAVGLLYAGHRDGAVENDVGGFDTRWRITPNWVATAQILASDTHGLQSESASGSAIKAGLEASGRTFAYQLAMSDISRDFQALSGFVPRTDIRQATQVASATLRPAGKWLTSWGPKVTTEAIWDHAGTVLEQTMKLETQFEMRRSSRLSVFRSVNPERLRVQDTPGLPAATWFAQHMTGITFGSAPFARVAFSGDYSVGSSVNLSPAQGLTPGLGGARQVDVAFSLRPIPAFAIDTTYLWSELADTHEQIAFADRIVRSQWNYQMTRRLSLRAIAQYETLAVDRIESSLTPRRTVNVDVLLTYLVQPGTALYVGWTSDRQALDRPKTNQLFAKMSYLFRF